MPGKRLARAEYASGAGTWTRCRDFAGGRQAARKLPGPAPGRGNFAPLELRRGDRFAGRSGAVLPRFGALRICHTRSIRKGTGPMAAGNPGDLWKSFYRRGAEAQNEKVIFAPSRPGVRAI